MTSEGLDAPQADGVLSDSQIAEKIERSSLSAFEFERQQRAWIVSLVISNPDLFGVLEQRWIQKPFQPRVEHPAFIGLKNVAEHRALAAKTLDKFRFSRRHHTREQVAEPAEELRCRVDNQVGAVIDGMLKRRPEKGVVHCE